MESKLKPNGHHFYTSEVRKAYFASRLADATYDQLIPILKERLYCSRR